jgi:predicted NBD/HSP70 family sugar kinase
MKLLVIDVGGTSVKVWSPEQARVHKFPSGRLLTAKRMVENVLRAVKGWPYEAISIGYPGPVSHGLIRAEPKNLGADWVGFDFAEAFGCPVVLINDAAMQAIGSYTGGRMLFLGLGTGLGSTLIADGAVIPMELGHLPYKKSRSFEDYLGKQGLHRLGKAKWRRAVDDVVARLKDALVADCVVLGGGNAKKLATLPAGTRMGDNAHAFTGGQRLWEESWVQELNPAMRKPCHLPFDRSSGTR